MLRLAFLSLAPPQPGVMEKVKIRCSDKRQNRERQGKTALSAIKVGACQCPFYMIFCKKLSILKTKRGLFYVFFLFQFVRESRKAGFIERQRNFAFGRRCLPKFFIFSVFAEPGTSVEQPLSLDEKGEHYRFVQAEMVHPGVWRDDALFAVGELLRALHDAGREYVPEDASRCRSWYLREIGRDKKIWCHGDVAPWNLLTMDGKPYLLIDWEYAGAS